MTPSALEIALLMMAADSDATYELNELNELSPEVKANTDADTEGVNSFTSFNSSSGNENTADYEGPQIISSKEANSLGLFTRWLEDLRIQAAGGDPIAAKEYRIMKAHFDACERGEVRIPDHPNDELIRHWNERCRSLSEASDTE